MSERTEKLAWGAVLLSIIGAGIFGWWRQRRSSIGGYDDVKDIKPMVIHAPNYTYPSGPALSMEEKPKTRKRPVKRKCDPVEIVQESKSNTQILACRGEPLGRVQSARDAYDFVRGQSQLLQEEMIVLAMNSRNDIVATSMVHRGTAKEVMVNSADVFRTPIIHGASRMILVHNHPSGDPTPSPSDVEMTRKMKGLGDEMGIALLDHIIVGKDDFASLRDFVKLSD
jgi:hypothetical protein